MNIEITQRQKELLETEAVAVATINTDGSPNVIAISYAKVAEQDAVIITDNFMKQTVENIKKDPRICLAVWTKDWNEGYKFIGKAQYYTTGVWMNYVKKMKENKNLPAKGAIVINVNGIYKLG